MRLCARHKTDLNEGRWPNHVLNKGYKIGRQLRKIIEQKCKRFTPFGKNARSQNLSHIHDDYVN